MKSLKKFSVALLAVVMVAVCVVCFVACDNSKTATIKGVTDTTIYVGNTAGTTGALATIGGPFNVGIEAALWAYNEAGGYNGLGQEGEELQNSLKVAFKHYDDGGSAEQSVTLTEKLVHEDEVFAIVGDFAASCVEANLSVIKEEEVPMVYAAAGNDILHNDNAQSLADRGIFPVQPLNKTEGRMLILRAFAPATEGGMGATKVGIIANASDEGSKTLLAGINLEKANLTSAQQGNINVQEVTGDDYSAAVNALKNAGCDCVIITAVGTNYLSALKAIGAAEYKVNVLTTYNNASVTSFNDTKTVDGVSTQVMKEEYASVFNYVTLYSQAWLDITSTTEYYTNSEHALYTFYSSIYYTNYYTYYNNAAVYMYTTQATEAPDDATLATWADTMTKAALSAGIPGFKLSYWDIAEDLYDYSISAGYTAAEAFAYSYDAYAIAGYMAGNIFCQGLKKLEDANLALTRENYIDVMGQGSVQVPTANELSFENGLRQGVDSFALISIYNNNGAITSATVHTLTSLDAYRALIKG